MDLNAHRQEGLLTQKNKTKLYFSLSRRNLLETAATQELAEKNAGLCHLTRSFCSSLTLFMIFLASLTHTKSSGLAWGWGSSDKIRLRRRNRASADTNMAKKTMSWWAERDKQHRPDMNTSIHKNKKISTCKKAGLRRRNIKKVKSDAQLRDTNQHIQIENKNMLMIILLNFLFVLQRHCFVFLHLD